jgi:hypothetical protein
LAARTKTPPPVNRSERRSHGKKRKAPLALIVVPVVLIGAAIALVLVLTGNGDTIGHIIHVGGGGEPIPAFDFKAAKVTPIGTAEDADLSALQPKAEAAARATVPVLDDVFSGAFLDPNNWKDGSYDSAFEHFSDAASASASGPGLPTITLGAAAGDTYDTVSPSKGSINFDVLFDRDGNAFSVAAHVKFYALAQRKDDTYVAIVSHGVMFLRNTGGSWQVVGFEMKRNDHETEAPAASTSAGPSASSTSTGASGAS